MSPSAPGETIYFDDQPVTVRASTGPGTSRTLLALHGLTGDEQAMAIFFSRIPAHFRIVAPSAPFAAMLGGRSWVPGERQAAPQAHDLDRAVDWLRSLIEHVQTLYMTGREPVHLLGFSQGAAACFALATDYPTEVASIGSLSGFLPEGIAERLKPHTLVGLPIFIAHGSKDETVPVEIARQAVEILERAGAFVTYCEDEVGHKLSVSCFRSLSEFYRPR